jgi:hypothetical protein
MLRLVLDAMRTLEIKSGPLAFSDGATWYSEALLGSQFALRWKADPLGEGFTNADAVIGHFAFDPATAAGLRLREPAKQFVVIEAKMFSNLSVGTRNAPAFNQAARNIACMANAIARSRRPPELFDSLGFFVVAPPRPHRPVNCNLRECIQPESIRRAVGQRIAAYERTGRSEVHALRTWEAEWFIPLLDRLEKTRGLAVLSWDDCIDIVSAVDTEAGQELQEFYRRCLSFGRQ